MICIICKNNNFEIFSNHYKEVHGLFFCNDCNIISEKSIPFKLHKIYCRPAPYAVPAIPDEVIDQLIDTKVNAEDALCFCGEIVKRKRLPDHRKTTKNVVCGIRHCIRCGEKICSVNAFRGHICQISKSNFESIIVDDDPMYSAALPEPPNDPLSSFAQQYEEFLATNGKNCCKCFLFS